MRCDATSRLNFFFFFLILSRLGNFSSVLAFANPTQPCAILPIVNLLYCMPHSARWRPAATERKSQASYILGLM
ncbi:hypothetical protein GGS20DRAFT_536819 [Poronia punctata]|nr:hypothetical protein GGS20DRAFT_536819 [Poronia punctata]